MTTETVAALPANSNEILETDNAPDLGELEAILQSMRATFRSWFTAEGQIKHMENLPPNSDVKIAHIEMYRRDY